MLAALGSEEDGGGQIMEGWRGVFISISLASAAIAAGVVVGMYSEPTRQLAVFEFDYPPTPRKPECLFPPDFAPPGDMVVLGTEPVERGGIPLDFDLSDKGARGFKVEVIVDEPQKPVALLLTSSEPTVFDVSWTPSTRIVAVATVAFDDGPHHVAGVPKGTPMLALDGTMECMTGPTFWPYLELEAMRTAVQIFGRGITTLLPPQNGEVILRSGTVDRGALITSPDTSLSSFPVKSAP